MPRKNQCAVKLGRLGGKASAKAKAKPKTKAKAKPKTASRRKKRG